VRLRWLSKVWLVAAACCLAGGLAGCLPSEPDDQGSLVGLNDELGELVAEQRELVLVRALEPEIDPETMRDDLEGVGAGLVGVAFRLEAGRPSDASDDVQEIWLAAYDVADLSAVVTERALAALDRPEWRVDLHCDIGFWESFDASFLSARTRYATALQPVGVVYAESPVDTDPTIVLLGRYRNCASALEASERSIPLTPAPGLDELVARAEALDSLYRLGVPMWRVLTDAIAASGPSSPTALCGEAWDALLALAEHQSGVWQASADIWAGATTLIGERDGPGLERLTNELERLAEENAPATEILDDAVSARFNECFSSPG
jgi:hypothetical protein